MKSALHDVGIIRRCVQVRPTADGRILGEMGANEDEVNFENGEMGGHSKTVNTNRVVERYLRFALFPLFAYCL